MLIICAFSFLPRPRVARAPRMMAGKGAGSAAGGGGDLAGGGDEERNAQLASLRKMFDTPSSDGAASTEKEDARALGMFLDMPLCRFSWCILPAQQVTLNICSGLSKDASGPNETLPYAFCRYAAVAARVENCRNRPRNRSWGGTRCVRSSARAK